VLMVRRPDDRPMFLSDCHHCGRRELRELRGHRTLHHRPDGWWTTCRHCGSDVLVVADREPRAASPQAA
jgi:hypothetical protein